MTPHELDLLSRIVFRHLAESVQSWREIPIAPDAPEELDLSPGYKGWRMANCRKGLFKSEYEAKRKLIMDAERHLNDRGYKTTSIRSATPGTVSVRVASAGSWRLCVRVPEDTAERIIILGGMP